VNTFEPTISRGIKFKIDTYQGHTGTPEVCPPTNIETTPTMVSLDAIQERVG